MKKRLISLVVLVSGVGSVFAKQKPNVLFIMIDDLRPVLGTYDFPAVKSPNIDILASQGVQFNNAFCNVPVSGASRASLLTGIRPNFPSRFVNYEASADKDVPTALSLPELFKNNGYTTISNGKIFHHQFDKASSWSEPSWRPDTSTVINYADVDWIDSTSVFHKNPKTGAGPYFESATAPDSLYFDNKVAAKSINDLKRLAAIGNPFFLGVGFHKPHLPFNAPKRFYDMYPEVEIADNRFPIKNLPKQVVNSQEIFVYGRTENYNSEEFHYEARRAYYACVSYVDEQVGRVLTALKENGLEKNTIVVILGDHGWHLGEHNFWGKHNILYNCLQVPLIIKTPGVKPRKVNEFVEFVDIYPTLCNLSKIAAPPTLEGKSMVKVMKGKDKTWENIAVSEWKGARTLTTPEYSYSLWSDGKSKDTHLLFNHKTDPKENENIANKPESSELIYNFKKYIESFYRRFVKN